MMKKLALSILICIALFTFAACKAEDTKLSTLPEITVETSGGGSVAPIKSRVIDDIDYTDTELFQAILQEIDQPIPYIKLGETIQIAFADKDMDLFEMRDALLREDGTLKYTEPTQNVVSVQFNDGKGSFTLDTHMATFLSSHTKDYEPGATIRGFRLICDWEGKKVEYVFAVRTDAGKIGTGK